MPKPASPTVDLFASEKWIVVFILKIVGELLIPIKIKMKLKMQPCGFQQLEVIEIRLKFFQENVSFLTIRKK